MLFRCIPIVLILLTGCTTANVGSNAAENQTQELMLDGVAYEQAFRAAAQAAAAIQWQIASSDRDTGVISASYDGTISRWGDNVNIMVSESGTGSRVTVRSNLGQRPNRNHVAEYLDMLRASVE